MRSLAVVAILLFFQLRTNMNIEFRKLEIGEAQAVTGLRLVQRSGATHLALARGRQLSESALPAAGASGAMQFTPAGTVDSPASWDAKPFEDKPGIFATLYVRGESAVSWAMFHHPNVTKDSRVHIETFAVYDHPRFVKGQGLEQLSVSAVKYAGGQSIPVIFPRGGMGEGLSLFKEAGSYPDAIQDARLVQSADGFWLFLLQNQTGPDGGPIFRHLPSGRQAAVMLNAVHLNAALEVNSKPTRVFGAGPIYEFDADAAPGGRLAIFATTEDGAILGFGTMEPGKPMSTNAWQSVKMAMPLVSPSLLVNVGAIHIAALANMGTLQASIIYAAVPFQ